MRPDDVALFVALAKEMNANAERYERYGDADFVAALVMHKPGGQAFCVRVVFEAVRCAGVDAVDIGEADLADFKLDGPIDAWQEMFDDIVANGRATGMQTINSLALMGDRIALVGTDPMGLDKFSRYNQTLQEFFDGAAHSGASASK